MAAIHLIVGFMGFGKTTLAKKLEKELPAVRFTPDEFMQKLFSRNLPEAEFRTAFNIIDNLIWSLVEQVVNTGPEVILDYGFWSQQKRKEAFMKARRLTEKVIFHHIRCDMKIAKERVLARSKTDNEELFIDEHCFDLFAKCYEPLKASEGYEVIDHYYP